MPERFDVVVVGARCAGSSLAALLARRGLSVALVDKATFPSDTTSTHLFQNDAARVLAAVGVLDRVLASGAPWIEQTDLRIDDLRIVHRWPRRPDDPGPMLCVRRPVLDTLLVEAAEEAGATVRTGTRVTGLLEKDGRVAGVRAVGGDEGESTLEAGLVVGADGRGSTVARLAGARMYNAVPSQRMGGWAYYEGASPPQPATFFAQRWDEEYVIACPCDSGLYMVGVIPPADRADRFRAEPERAFDDHVAACEPVAAAVAGGRRTGPPSVVYRWTGYFRDSAGPGWALVGDAGHFKDPSPGQGITDAMRQAERLAAHVVDGLSGSRPLDQTLQDWWRWRDRDAQEMAWFAHDLGRGGRVPPVVVELLRRVTSEPAQTDRFFDVLNHRVRPSKIMTPGRLLGATGRLLLRREPAPAQVLGETKEIITQDLRRRRLNRNPRYGDARSEGSPEEATSG